MILPVALVDRWPSDEYKIQHATIESALKHSVADLLNLRAEVEMLKQLEHEWGLSPIPEELITKDIRGFIKRNGGDSTHQRLIDYVVNNFGVDEKLAEIIFKKYIYELSLEISEKMPF